MTPIVLCPEKVEVISLTCCILHNYLWNGSHVYLPTESIDHEDPVIHEVCMSW